LSHELRTPLTAVKGSINYLERTMKDEEQLEFIGIIEKNISRLTRLISNLFDFTKLEAGTIEWEFEREDISQLVLEVIEIMSPLALQKKIRIEQDCPIDLYAVIDLERMEQVLVNLIDNAIKFSTHDSKVTITVTPTEDHIKISITDQGPGISSENLETIFKKFYTASKETNVVIGDSGLFLSDTGGHYLTGTTDITRTISRGVPSREEIKDYTLVLKGHIAVAVSLFPHSARGYQIDALARQYLWNEGMDFGHGTGHGVGFFLCVHEGPARISPFPVDIKLKDGMLLTNEPGVYREGKYGIRLENMILVKKALENEFGTFLKFDNMTYCHFENELIDKTLLTQKEIGWINDYHTMVYEKVSSGLKPEVADWLKKKTQPI